VNYYEHHIRDYDAATAHLSWDEDMAYTRMLRWYYRKEQPLPVEVSEVCRLVRATSKQQRAAVEAVLREFFVLREDGWHNEKCDQVLDQYQAGEPEREAKKRNEDTRLQRHRAERAALFSELNAAGQHMPWNSKMEDLRGAVERIRNGGTAVSPATPATAPATPATATHPPSTNTHPPEQLILSGGVPAAPTPAPTPAPTKPPKPAKEKKPEPPTNAVWTAYAHAYKRSYGVEPVRNASVNGKLSQFVQRIPQEEAADVARFYLACKDRLYTEKGHPVGLLLQDAETLRMRWCTARERIQAEPAQSDRAKRAMEALAPLGLSIKPATALLPLEDHHAAAD
jgi:uncharacterized protein YdaU (DUF1376 family)